MVKQQQKSLIWGLPAVRSTGILVCERSNNSYQVAAEKLAPRSWALGASGASGATGYRRIFNDPVAGYFFGERDSRALQRLVVAGKGVIAT
jgi:hypothetical protein